MRQGSLVFCVSKALKLDHAVSEEEGSTSFAGGGSDASPCKSSAAERERMQPQERMSVFAGNGRHHAHPCFKTAWKCLIRAINGIRYDCFTSEKCS